jgi:hypothetical protein
MTPSDKVVIAQSDSSSRDILISNSVMRDPGLLDIESVAEDNCHNIISSVPSTILRLSGSSLSSMSGTLKERRILLFPPPSNLSFHTSKLMGLV